MNDVRKKKVESLIQGILSRMILMQEIKDPRVSTFLSVNAVTVSNDLSQAKATYLNGFLRIDVPLAQTQAKSTKVPIAEGNY